METAKLKAQVAGTGTAAHGGGGLPGHSSVCHVSPSPDIRALLNRTLQVPAVLGPQFAPEDRKITALREAVCRKTQEIVASLLMRLRLAMQSPRMPLDELQRRLADTTATHGAIRAALAKPKEHGESVAEELSRLETAVSELARLTSALGGK